MISGHHLMTFAAFRPGKPLVLVDVKRDQNYIRKLRAKEQAFMEALIKRGLGWQRSFHGWLVN
jgi:hypothetical protein